MKFETPVVEVVKFDVADIITTSNTETPVNPLCPNEIPEFD